jgi:hypothetical protein
VVHDVDPEFKPLYQKKKGERDTGLCLTTVLLEQLVKHAFVAVSDGLQGAIQKGEMSTSFQAGMATHYCLLTLGICKGSVFTIPKTAHLGEAKATSIQCSTQLPNEKLHHSKCEVLSSAPQSHRKNK